MHTLQLIPATSRDASLYRIPLSFILDLRHRVLRPGLPPESAHFTGDDEPSTWHMAILHPPEPIETADVVCCASFMLSDHRMETAWHLRGMATDPEHQKKGFGQKLLAGSEKAIVEATSIRLFWCNARISAVRFYQNHGWSPEGEIFDMPTVGPHIVMTKRI